MTVSMQAIWQQRKGLRARKEDKVYQHLADYAGEVLTIEKIRVTPFKSFVYATVRFDANTEFDITIYKAQWELFTQAGYVLPTELGEHTFHADIVPEFRKNEHSSALGLHVIHVYPKAPGPTPLQAQSAIYWLLKHDAYLQKIATVELHHDLHGKPIVRIQVQLIHKGVVEAVVNPMAQGVALLWGVIPQKAFTGTFKQSIGDRKMIHITNITDLKAHLAEGKSLSRFSTDVTLARADLAGADLTRADLAGADLTGADLYCADLRGAELRGADLRDADLTDAYLYGATMNWYSHDLIAERLRQVAGDDYLLRLAAGFVLVSRDLCHEELLQNMPVIAHPQHGTVMAWALRTMATWRKAGGDFPAILEKAITALDKETGNED